MIDTEKYVKVVSESTPIARQSEGVEILNQNITVHANGVYQAESGYTGLGVVTVDVPGPEGSVTYTENGTYDITNYASVTVSVPNGTESKTITANGTYTPSGSNIGFSSVTVNVQSSAFAILFQKNSQGQVAYTNSLPDIGDCTGVAGYAFAYKFYHNELISGAITFLSGITELKESSSCESMFEGAINITSCDLSSLDHISNSYISPWNTCDSMFRKCTGLTSVSCNSLQDITAIYGCLYMFDGCTSLSTFPFGSVKYLRGSQVCAYCFQGCTSLTSVTWSNLELITGNGALSYGFKDCTSLTSLSFPKLNSDSFGSDYTNQFSNMLKGVTGCTVHFPSNLQSVIGSWSAVTNGFAGTNTTVLFDLPATE